MGVFPEEAREKARIGRDIERRVIDGHRRDWKDGEGAIAPAWLDVAELKNVVCYPVAVAYHSLAHHLNAVRLRQPRNS